MRLTHQKKDLAYHLTEHLRVNGVYWGLTALCIMGHQDALDREAMVEYVLSCWDDEAGMSMRLCKPPDMVEIPSRF